MAHDFGVTPKFLSLTPTRDNVTAPGARLADKHTRLFCGKTLDEWTMLQLWSSKYLGEAVFICETLEHKHSLEPLGTKYGVRLLVRPWQMLSPVCDSGAIPVSWAADHVLRDRYYDLVTTPLVVSPCRRPGFFDYMTEEYLRLFRLAPDRERGELWVMGGHNADAISWEVDKNGRGRQLGTEYYNALDNSMVSMAQDWMGATHWWKAFCQVRDSRHSLGFSPKIFEIEPWEDVHIDTEADWTLAEHWFKEHILSKGEDCYERYRASWADGATGSTGVGIRRPGALV